MVVCLLFRAENRLCADFEDEKFKTGIALWAMLTQAVAADAKGPFLSSPFLPSCPRPPTPTHPPALLSSSCLWAVTQVLNPQQADQETLDPDSRHLLVDSIACLNPDTFSETTKSSFAPCVSACMHIIKSHHLEYLDIRR